jgi:hypothetical protein
MEIFIDYTVGSLKNIPIINLDPTVNTVILSFEYKISYEEIQKLKTDFQAYSTIHSNEDFFRFAKKSFKDYFKIEIKAIDIEDRNNYIKIDVTKLRKIINFQIISAKRNVGNEASNKTLSTLSHRYFEKSEDPCEPNRIKLKKALLDADEELT